MLICMGGETINAIRSNAPFREKKKKLPSEKFKYLTNEKDEFYSQIERHVNSTFNGLLSL